MTTPILYAVYYKNILASRIIYPKGTTQRIPAIFHNWEQAQEFADSLNDSLSGYFVTKIKYKTEKEIGK